jgi:hypothetical protein
LPTHRLGCEKHAGFNPLPVRDARIGSDFMISASTALVAWPGLRQLLKAACPSPQIDQEPPHERQQPHASDDFRQQVVTGRHPDGTELEADMPRWQMSDSDLADVFAFLKALPE